MFKISITRNHISKAFLLGIGLALFGWFLHLTYEKQEIKAQLDLQKELESSISMIKDDLYSSTEVLYSISNLLNTFEDVSELEFSQFTRHLSNRKKAILMIEWQPKVSHKDRDSFITKARRLTNDSFDILEPGEDNKFIKAKEREYYYPVLYGVSTRDQKTAIGLDLGWSPLRMKSKYESRDKGKPIASTTFGVMLSEAPEILSRGFAITLPVYHTQDTPQSLEKRREHIKGYLASVIYIEDLLGPVKERIEKMNLSYIISDNQTHTIISDNSKEAKNINERFRLDKIIDIYGKQWKFEIIASDQFFKPYLNSVNYIYPFILLMLILIMFYFLIRNEKRNNELLETKKKLQGALKEANAATDSKMIFLANMSHEIRTPMNAILGYTNLIKNEREEDQRSYFIERMKKNGEHLLNILDDILYISSHEEEKLTLKEGSFDLYDLIEEVTSIFIIRDTDNVKFKQVIPENISCLYGDAVRLKQILINLISNSYKFTDTGEIILECSPLKESQNNYLLNFKVKDTGVGIDSNYIENAYNPFTQENESFKRNKGGVGLGLSIVKNLVDLLGGEISVDSTKGIGTCFSVTLPFKKCPEVKSQPNPTQIKGSDNDQGESTRKTKVLIAEDDEDARFLIQVYLKNENLDITLVENGNELIKCMNESSFDIILSDIQMPECDGLSATKALRDKGVTIPIILMSAHALQEEKEKGLKAGANEFITKPIDKESIISAIIKFQKYQS